MKGNDEISTTNGDLPWLPFDERFNDEKNSGKPPSPPTS
jgi:hypothetical protein